RGRVPVFVNTNLAEGDAIDFGKLRGTAFMIDEVWTIHGVFFNTLDEDGGGKDGGGGGGNISRMVFKTSTTAATILLPAGHPEEGLEEGREGEGEGSGAAQGEDLRDHEAKRSPTEVGVEDLVRPETRATHIHDLMHVARVPALQTPNHAVSAEEGLRHDDEVEGGNARHDEVHSRAKRDPL
ncbi:unnamed protein product, partial [Symbiodinium microadriaticum]